MEDTFISNFRDADVKLRQLSGNRLSVEPVRMQFIPIEEVGSLSGGEDACVNGVGMSLLSTPPLHYIILMSPTARETLLRTVLGVAALSDTALCDSFLREIGNVFGTSIANSLSNLLERGVNTSPPELIQDMAGAILNTVLSVLHDVDEHVLMTEVSLRADGNPVDCSMYLFFGPSLRTEIESVLQPFDDNAKGKTGA